MPFLDRGVRTWDGSQLQQSYFFRKRPFSVAAISAVLSRKGGQLFLLSQERCGQSVEIAHRIVRARMPAFEKFVEHPPLAEQPMALHAPELVLVDTEGSHLERVEG